MTAAGAGPGPRVLVAYATAGSEGQKDHRAAARDYPRRLLGQRGLEPREVVVLGAALHFSRHGGSAAGSSSL